MTESDMEQNAESKRHPDLAELDACRTGEASDDVVAHVQSCAQCQARLEGLRALASQLAAPPSALVPDNADRAVMEMIARRSEEIRKQPRLIRLVPRTAWAAAAVLLLCCSLWVFHVREPGRRAAPARRLAADVDGNGSVDIVDAYLMARRVKDAGAGAALSMTWDLNHDGLVDGRDVDVVAGRAVSIGGEGS